MDGTRFDRLTRVFRNRLTRRAGLGVLLAAGLVRAVPDDSTAAKKKKRCKAPKKRCGNRCVVVKSDRLNCGGCNRRCQTGETCAAGVCRLGVSQIDFAFRPEALTVPVGTTVVWTNTGRAVHDVTANDGVSFASGPMAPGGRFSFTFTAPGVYPYNCTPHPGMDGTVTVTA